MYSVNRLLVQIVLYYNHSKGTGSCDRRTGKEPDDLSKISPSHKRAGCFVKAGDDPESTKPAAAGYEEEHTMSINELEAKARELRQLQALIDEAQAEAEDLKDAIKAAMGDREAIQAGEYKITWKAVTASRVDTVALRKALPDVAERFTHTTTTRRFCVA